MKWMLLFLLISACTKDELPIYTREEFLVMAREGAPDLKIVAPKDLSDRVVDCRDFTPECRYGYRVIVNEISFVTLYYEKAEDALVAAKRLKAYYSRNWVLDEVRGEPVLERFCTKHLKAKKAF